MKRNTSQESERSTGLPAPSIVIEWENVVLSTSARANRMLERLASQLRELAPELEGTPEVLVLFDPEKIHRGQLNTVVEKRLGGATADPYDAKVISSPAAEYYQQKNRGAGQARNEVIVFLDSDAIPEDGWLEALLSPFRVAETDVVAGHTYLDDDSVYAAAVKYFWFFPTREQEPGDGFFANNVAFRKEVFLGYEFPEAETFRGQCRRLASELESDGIDIHQQPSAVCSHPPPNGARHFAVRALCAGHDAERLRRTRYGSWFVGFPVAFVNFLANLLAAGKRTLVRARVEPGLPDLGVLLGAVILGVAYYALVFVGQTLTVLAPNLIASRFHI